MADFVSRTDYLYKVVDLLEAIATQLDGTTVEERKAMANQSGRWVMDAVVLGALSSPEWSSFRGVYNARFLEFVNDNYALLFTEMVTWCRDNASLVPAAVDVPADLKRPSVYAEDGQITFDPERWLRHGCPLFAGLIRQAVAAAAASSESTVPDAADEDEKPEQPPALTEPQRITLCAMNSFDRSVLVAVNKICDAMAPTLRLGEETVRQCVKRLIALDLAERPDGERRGARLTNAGRRLAGKIAD